MDKINGAGHVGRQFVTEDAGTNRPPTEITADWLNAVQGELVEVIEGAGLVLSSLDNTQLAAAIKTIFQKAAPISAAAGGTVDAITGNFTPVVAGLANHMLLIVRASGANTSITPSFTPAPGTISAKTIVKGHNLPLVAGDISGAGFRMALQYDQPLDKWVLLNPATGVTAAASASIQGAFKNLQVSSSGLSANIAVTADEIAVESAANNYQTLRAVNLTIAGTAVGVANGLDTGALAINTWYSVWVIWNGVTTAGLLSLSATAPTLPAGYTHKARVGWVRTDGTGNKYPLPFYQKGRRVQYAPVAGANLTALPQMAMGTAGSTTTPTWVAVAWGSFAPPTASAMMVLARQPAGGPGVVIVAPNNNYGGYQSATNAPPICASGGSGVDMTVTGSLVPEGANVYWAAGGSASSYIAMFGWEDNL